MNPHELDAHVQRGLESLRKEFSGRVSAELVAEIGTLRFEALCATATINDFIPLLVYRQTRDELLTAEIDELHESA